VRPGPGVEVVAADRGPDIIDDADLGVNVDRQALVILDVEDLHSLLASRMASAWPSVAGST
jgi:hypothetical protein